MATPKTQFAIFGDGFYSFRKVSARISGDATHVLFMLSSTYADNQGNNTNSSEFRLETVGGTVVAQAPALTASVSADGSVVAFDRQRDVDDYDRDVYAMDVASGTTTLISAAVSGGPANGSSWNPAISADGTVVAFESTATDLTPQPDTATRDIYRHRINTGTTEVVTMSTTGGPADGVSFAPAISADGSIIAFTSSATNLVADDGNGTRDVFSAAVGGPIVKRSTGLGGTDADGASYGAVISGDGTTVGFYSEANNLVVGDTTAAGWDLYVAGLTDPIELVSIRPDGAQVDSAQSYPLMGGISDDGSVVLFFHSVYPREPYPFPTNLVLSRHRPSRTSQVISRDSSGAVRSVGNDSPSLSGDGRYALLSSFEVIELDPDSASFEVKTSFSLQAARDVRVDSVTPSNAPIGQTTQLTIHGVGFTSDAQVVGRADPGGVSYANVVVVDDSTITATASVAAGAAPGVRNVWVDIPHSAPSRTGWVATNVCHCLTIQ